MSKGCIESTKQAGVLFCCKNLAPKDIGVIGLTTTGKKGVVRPPRAHPASPREGKALNRGKKRKKRDSLFGDQYFG